MFIGCPIYVIKLEHSKSQKPLIIKLLHHITPTERIVVFS